MIINVTLCIAGILMSLATSFSLIYVNKFKVYMDFKKKSGGFCLKVLDTTWKILLPVLFGLVTLIMPIKILCFFITDSNIIKDLGSFYLYSFIFSFFICILFLIKRGKIRTKNTFE